VSCWHSHTCAYHLCSFCKKRFPQLVCVFSSPRLRLCHVMSCRLLITSCTPGFNCCRTAATFLISCTPCNFIT
jgi:hypothetical protein